MISSINPAAFLSSSRCADSFLFRQRRFSLCQPEYSSRTVLPMGHLLLPFNVRKTSTLDYPFNPHSFVRASAGARSLYRNAVATDSNGADFSNGKSVRKPIDGIQDSTRLGPWSDYKVEHAAALERRPSGVPTLPFIK